MLTRIRKAMDEKDQGFTLIELLVVMIIIGILAAIAIPVFLNQREKARDTAAKSDVSTLGKEVATYYVDANAVLPAASVTQPTPVALQPASTRSPVRRSATPATTSLQLSSATRERRRPPLRRDPRSGASP